MPRCKSPLAGKTVKIKSGDLAGLEITIEDWWENVSGKSWMASGFSPAAVQYAARVQRANLPRDDDVVYGKVLSGIGCLVHVSELDRDKEKE